MLATHWWRRRGLITRGWTPALGLQVATHAASAKNYAKAIQIYEQVRSLCSASGAPRSGAHSRSAHRSLSPHWSRRCSSGVSRATSSQPVSATSPPARSQTFSRFSTLRAHRMNHCSTIRAIAPPLGAGGGPLRGTRRDVWSDT